MAWRRAGIGGVITRHISNALKRHGKTRIRTKRHGDTTADYRRGRDTSKEVARSQRTRSLTAA
ncbi:hypothetical protein ATY48_06275 [Xanthomonas oryzae pv. oryzae]|nr:hypothetical protein AZ54_17905 [Xanthomonas oryzae pv. oryzae PXO86]ALZ72895.1 hypothetical protein APZ20_16800 [Xanthomonas oryzae pv. oryzae]AOS01721.1 hypothetical protein ATY42_06270 [Xanthomonas oryzae pv. oryzae]AOS07522.1 hypothetical protein ATY43_17510 [Xanthomonas oryzae pv. oryzae]AOS11699.1 hypothetical protein ATY44_16930 [Xanthomonas oryzae pv. oryzae]